MNSEQMEARIRELESRLFGADYVRTKDAENEAESAAKDAEKKDGE